jgi:hypothetical protein
MCELDFCVDGSVYSLWKQDRNARMIPTQQWRALTLKASELNGGGLVGLRNDPFRSSRL